jgi:hypothetical protein
MVERDLSVEYLAAALQAPIHETEALLAGLAPINADRAERLSTALGASARFWLTREAEYVEDRIRVMAADWSSGLPLTQMQKFGWIRRPTSWRDEIDECLNFFGVQDFEDWQEHYATQVASAHYRKSPSFHNEESATLVWFRAGEREIENLEVAQQFSPEELRSEIPRLRKLTRIADPSKFIPALQAVCGEVGLAVVVVRAPDGCRASGATRWIDGRPTIQLSARHLSDDHFWFTLFHEIGHVLCHGESDRAFIDIDSGEADDAIESEADTFATAAIFDQSAQVVSFLPTQDRDVIREAARVGISSGLLAGQLQHRGVVPRDRFNRLKRRYRWDGTVLVTK